MYFPLWEFHQGRPYSLHWVKKFQVGILYKLNQQSEIPSQRIKFSLGVCGNSTQWESEELCFFFPWIFHKPCSLDKVTDLLWASVSSFVRCRVGMCYRLNICVPLKFRMLKPNFPSVMVWRWCLWEAFKS